MEIDIVAADTNIDRDSYDINRDYIDANIDRDIFLWRILDNTP